MLKCVEHVYEMKEMAKNDEKIVRLGRFLLTKTFFSILQSQSGQNELILNI